MDEPKEMEVPEFTEQPTSDAQ